MAVAAFVRHKAHLHLAVATGLSSARGAAVEGWGDPEKALLYLAVLLAILLLGPGRWSLERWVRRRPRATGG